MNARLVTKQNMHMYWQEQILIHGKIGKTIFNNH